MDRRDHSISNMVLKSGGALSIDSTILKPFHLLMFELLFV